VNVILRFRISAWTAAAIVAVVPFCAQASDGFDLLAGAASPYRTLSNPTLAHYTVPVALGGLKSFELKQLARDQQLEDPRFEEMADAGGVFRLVAVNPDYSRDLRDEISTQLLPFQLFFTVTSDERDAELKGLRLRATATVVDDDGLSRVTILPAASEVLRGGVQSLASGGRRLTRTLGTTYWVDVDNGTINRILNQSAFQDIAPDGTPAGEGATMTDDLRVQWDHVGGRAVPVRMVQNYDGVDLWEQRIRYREIGENVLFDARELDYFTGPKGLRSTAVAEYGEYRLTPKR